MNVNQTIKKSFSRAAMMLLATILLSMTAQTAWATQTTVSLSGNATDGYYINMPEKNTATSFNNAAVLTLDGSIKTFKLYDDGGESGNYSKAYNGYLVINAPSNYYIHFAGTLDQLGGGATKLTVYDNNTNNTSGYDILYDQPGSQLDVDETSTGSAITVWHKTASSFEAYEDTGFDFTVTLIEKGAYDDLYAEVSSDGKAMTLKCTTTGTATTDASAGRYKYKFIRSGFNWASEFTTTSKSAITTVNVDASCANYTGTNLEELFRGFTALTTITGLTNLRTTNVKRMNNMFDHCSKLTMVDLGTWDTRSVAQNRMGSMFNNCSSLTAIIVGPNWQAAEKSRYMFYFCNSLVGGAGTKCPENFYVEYDWTYAHVDGGTANPGYLTADWTGSGDSGDPYIINCKAHLDLLALRVNAGNDYYGKFFKLGADIIYDGTANNFTPIGNVIGEEIHPFSGTFDGNGNTISGLNINLPETDCVGLFGQTSFNATIKNLTLTNSTITGMSYVGGILGFGDSHSTTIQNCAVTSTTVSGGYRVGGIVGMYATVRGCISAATVSGQKYVGGIIGNGDGSIVEHCLYTISSVAATNGNRGAITGCKDDKTSLTANYYTAETLPCKGVNGSDVDGARKALTVTFDDVNIVPSGAETAYGVSGITDYDDNHIILYNDGTNSTYYAGDGESVALSYTGALDDGYAVRYTVNSGDATAGNTITMPATNATIAATTADVWGVTGGADGSEAKPYIIKTTEGLDLLAQKVNAGYGYNQKYFKLDRDITYDKNTENNFTAIGFNYFFSGHFDGNGKTISGIRIYKSGYSSTANNIGLFGLISSSAEVKNVTLADTRITAWSSVGGIVGDNHGKITDCHVTNTVEIQTNESGWNTFGGIVGFNNGEGTVSGCISESTLTHANTSKGSRFGGIAGCNNGTLKNNFVIGATIPAATYDNSHGAIAGQNNNGTLTNNYYSACTVAGTANATNVGVGESVGDMAGARRAVAIGTAEGVTITPTGEATTYNVSGITAYADNTVIGYNSKLYASASDAVKLNISYAVEGYVATGYTDGNGHALTANNDGTYTLTMTATAPTITATVDDVWGMAKGADGTSEAKAYTITTTAGLDLLAKKVNAGTDYYDTYFKLGADITYTHKADGEEGADTENNFTSIGNYYKWFDGHFDGKGYTISGIRIYKGGTDYSTDGYQGLFGNILSYAAEVKNITLADTRITAASQTGGIAGASSGTIANCHVTNTVKIRGIYENANRLGGIVGENGGGTVSGCISEARLTNVSGSWWYGGIAGYIFGTESTLENNFVIGATIPSAQSDSHGAIVGQNFNGTLKNNYYTACTVAGTANATNVGSNNTDVAANDGALSVHQITFAEGVTDVTIDAGAKAYSYDSKDYYAQGKSVKLTWTPATGYIFSSINAGEDVTGTLSENTYTITMPAKDVTVSVSFKKLLTNTDISVAGIADQTCTGSKIEPAITVKDGETDITGQCDITYTDNTAVGTATVTITAKAASNAYAGETTTTFDILRQMKDLFADGQVWTGYVAEEDLDLPAGLTAYAITALGEASATATALNYIPKGVPVLLSRADKDVNLYLAPAGSGTAPTTNLLKVASTTVQPTAYQDYALYKDAFILYGGGTLASGKVFLALPQSSKSRPATRSIVIDGDDTTGMSEALSVESEESAGDWYDLQGRRLEGRPLKRGLYIHNGQKTVIK